MVLETELKLRLPPNRNAAFRRWMAAHAANAAAPETEQLLSIYYDTPTLELAQRDIGLRLRRVGDHWLQTVKLGEQAGTGLHQRQELETEVSGEALELERIVDRKIRQLLPQEDVASVLAPLFSTDIKRTRWIVRDARGNILEVCLDQGTIRAQGQSIKLNEVEIELKQGDVQAVFDLALQLASALPLIPDSQSKAERGYALCRNTPLPAASKARLPPLHTTLTPHRALKMIVQETLRHLQANVAGILDNDDMECVHQARVALRRLRSAQKAFAPLAASDEWQSIMTDAQWLASLLGRVRDLDVFLAETLPGIEAALAPDADFAPLKSALQGQRERCRREAHAAVISPRHGTLQLRLLAWLNRPAPRPKGKAIPLRDFSRRSLQQRWRPCARLARDWSSLNQEQRHELRKRAKKLRYTVEFFSPLYKPKRVAHYLEQLQALQQI
ncbi:MAG TPA: CHAD domain-containing protein, partial [Pseudogulbenkiania sp.]|nr:CHAD domain-containing protein [Pseudogulbenkiania sp.]